MENTRIFIQDRLSICAPAEHCCVNLVFFLRPLMGLGFRRTSLPPRAVPDYSPSSLGGTLSRLSVAMSNYSFSIHFPTVTCFGGGAGAAQRLLTCLPMTLQGTRRGVVAFRSAPASQKPAQNGAERSRGIQHPTPPSGTGTSKPTTPPPCRPHCPRTRRSGPTTR